MRRNVIFAPILLLLAIFTLQAQSVPLSGYVPHRVYAAGEKKYSDFEAMVADLARADVVFVGEQHDDPATHKLELAVLEGVARRRDNVVLSLEMFERDAQKYLDDYLAGRISEEEFLKNSRPWGNYATDYRPLVEFAKAKGWRVVAGNVPRRYASQVARGGLEVIDKLPENERGFVARDIKAPTTDDYFKNFEKVMTAPTSSGASGGHGGGMNVERVYQAQVVKDETMAESIAQAYQEASAQKPLVIHYNGAFHSDYRLGTAERAAKRLPQARIKVVSVVPTENLDSIKADDYRKRGDYVVFAIKLPKASAKEK